MFRLFSSAALALALAGCGGGSDATQGNNAPGGSSYTVLLRSGQAVAVPQESLTLLMTEVRDSRCPIDALCVWAGHASIVLNASQTGRAPEVLQIGLPAPAGTPLPGEARYHGLRLTLQQLDPAPRAATPMPLEAYRATVVVERLP